MLRNFRLALLFSVARLLRIPITVHQRWFETADERELKNTLERAASSRLGIR